MTQFFLFVLWMTIGLIASASAPQPGESRFAWAPLAALLGPLWLTIAQGRREHVDSAVH